MNKYQNYDVVISAHQPIDSANVTEDELRLISAIFPELLKEMIQYIEQDKE